MAKKIKCLSIHGEIGKPSISDCCKIASFGNYLGYPGTALLMNLDHYDINYTVDDDFDIIVFYDLDEDLFSFAKSLPKHVKKGLITAESPVHCELCRHPNTLCDSVWDFVIHYNREIAHHSEFASPKMFHYDIAVTGTQCPIPRLTPLELSSPKGVFIGRYKGMDFLGNNQRRDALMAKLAANNEIVIYGTNWPGIPNYLGETGSKPKTVSDYRFSVVVENVKTSGYVTEKLPDSILGERPAVYFGDDANARRRFGDTFVCMQDLTYEAFLEAKNALLENYDFYHKNCIHEKSQSEKWISSFIDTATHAILSCLQN